MTATILTIGSSNIRSIGNLFSLNDLHQASGSNPNQRPGEFIRTQQTQDLVTEISNAGIHAFEAKRGAGGGTYACRELVIAYAAWISAAFHLKVIRVFLDATTPASSPYSVHPHQTLSGQQAQALRDLVSTTAKTMPKEVQAEFTIKAWSKLKAHFKVAYREIPTHEYEEAVSIVARHIDAYNERARTPQFITIDRSQLETLWFDLGQMRDRLNAMASDPRLSHQGAPLGV